jgi:hypothetical protein
MDWNVLRRCPHMRWTLALAVPHCSGADLHWMVMTGWICGASMLLLVAVGAIPSEAGEIIPDVLRQEIFLAHPEWPPEMRAALLAGIICAGMPADMVRVAWGFPTHTSHSDGPGQPVTWYYTGRPSVVERLAGEGLGDTGSSEWTVSFVDGQVVAWTD